jgi:hypothetical protein
VIGQAAALALAKYNVSDPSATIEQLKAGLTRTRVLREDLEHKLSVAQVGSSIAARTEAAFLLAQKEREFGAALRLATGVRVDALAEVETVAPGDTFTVAVRAFLGDERLAHVRELNLRAPAGWRVERTGAPRPDNASSYPAALGVGRERPQVVTYFLVTVPADAQR